MNEFEKKKDQINKSLAWAEKDLAWAQEEQGHINDALANLKFKDERKRKDARRMLEEMKEINARRREIITEQKKRLEDAQRVHDESQASLDSADPSHK